MADEFQTVEIRGIEEVCASLEEAAPIVKGIALTKGLKAAADVMEEYVTGALVSGDPQEITGELLADLGSTVDIITNGEQVGGVAMVGFSSDQGHVARFVEWGHRQVTHRPELKEVGHVRPHPFMRPAADVGWEASVDAFEEAVDAVLTEEGVTDAA